jgi:hypothetical protein
MSRRKQAPERKGTKCSLRAVAAFCHPRCLRRSERLHSVAQLLASDCHASAFNQFAESHNLSQPVEQEGHRHPGFNLFDPSDENLLCSIVRGEFNISGLQNKPCVGICPNSTAARLRVCSNGSAPME